MRRSHGTLAHTFAAKRVRFRACFKELINFPPATSRAESMPLPSRKEVAAAAEPKTAFGRAATRQREI